VNYTVLFCPQCQTNFVSGVPKFCGSCGLRQDRTTWELTHGCGCTIQTNATAFFCPECGVYLRSSAPHPSQCVGMGRSDLASATL